MCCKAWRKIREWCRSCCPLEDTLAIQADPPTVIRIQPGAEYPNPNFNSESPSALVGQDFSETNQRFREGVDKQIRRRNNASQQEPEYSEVNPQDLPVRNPAINAARDSFQDVIDDKKEFDELLSQGRLSDQQAEKRMRLEKEETDRKTDLEHQQLFENQRREQAEELRRAKEELEKFEDETARLMEEKKNQFKTKQAMFIQCFLLEKHFENRENEWATWLEAVKSPISHAKTRFELFERIVRSLDMNGNSYQNIVSRELLALHKSISSAYDTVFEAWTTAKILGEQAPDRIFLKILQKDLVSVANKLASSLTYLDECMKNQQNLHSIRQYFGAISTRDIPNTGQLRERSKTARFEDYQNIEEPINYRSSNVGFVDVSDEARVETFF